jgi:polar amino acid transport system substrate-binding protein
MSKPLVLLIGAICAIGLSQAQSRADTLDDVKQKGVLVVGTKADYAPFGFRDTSGNIVGLEADLAADVAKRLGVKLELVPVTSANRMQLLQDGKIDLMIATMSVTPEREDAVGIVSPEYYATRFAVLAPKSANIKDESDLKDKRICSLAGAFFNNRLQAEFTHQELAIFNGVPDNEAALLAGKCAGFVFDDVLLIYKTKSQPEKWKDFEIVVLDEFDPVPWGIAVRRAERNGAWGKFVSGVISTWLKSDILLSLEAKWIGQNTIWLKSVHTRMLSMPG